MVLFNGLWVVVWGPRVVILVKKLSIFDLSDKSRLYPCLNIFGHVCATTKKISSGWSGTSYFCW